MSTPRRFHWLKALLSLTLLIGLSAPIRAEDNAPPKDNGVEQYFWICLEDHTATQTASAAQCCDGAACYTCLSDFSECWISSDPSGRVSQKPEFKLPRPSIRPMQESPSEGQLQAVCSRAKANFTRLKSFGYSCVKPNCNGKGDYCSIICHGDRLCSAGTPDVIKGAVSLLGILQNGDNIGRGDPGSAEESGGGGAANGDGGSPCGPDGCLY